jgi:hypothetical protein
MAGALVMELELDDLVLDGLSRIDYLYFYDIRHASRSQGPYSSPSGWEGRGDRMERGERERREKDVTGYCSGIKSQRAVNGASAWVPGQCKGRS